MTELTESAEIGTATVVPSRRRFTTFARTTGGIAAIGVKEPAAVCAVAGRSRS